MMMMMMIVLVAMLIVLFIFVIVILCFIVVALFFHDHCSVNMVYFFLCCSYRVCGTVCHMFVDQYECCHMFVVCHMLENAVKRWHRGLSNLRDC